MFMDYIEFHVTKDTLERAVFFSIIFILLIISIISYKTAPGSCPEIACNYTSKIHVIQQPAVQAQPAQQQEQTKIYYVDMQNLHFAPRDLVINNGSMVIFQNKEPGTAHKIYEVRRLFISPKMNPSDTFNFTFTKLGNYTIWSTTGLEDNMKMTIEVIP
jgi:plastocyanin